MQSAQNSTILLHQELACCLVSLPHIGETLSSLLDIPSLRLDVRSCLL